jgi:hypothetical protein
MTGRKCLNWVLLSISNPNGVRRIEPIQQDRALSAFGEEFTEFKNKNDILVFDDFYDNMCQCSGQNAGTKIEASETTQAHPSRFDKR